MLVPTERPLNKAVLAVEQTNVSTETKRQKIVLSTPHVIPRLYVGAAPAVMQTVVESRDLTLLQAGRYRMTIADENYATKALMMASADVTSQLFAGVEQRAVQSH